MTITYRYFYTNIIQKSQIFSPFIDIYHFVELINFWHKEKIIFTELNKKTKDIFSYIENLLDIEFIFFEFCEMIFYLSMKYFKLKFIHHETKENYMEIITHMSDLIRSMEPIYVSQEKFKYSFPKDLPHHKAYETILETKKQKEEEELRKKNELKRLDFERKFMDLEDANALPEIVENEDMESNDSGEDISF